MDSKESRMFATDGLFVAESFPDNFVAALVCQKLRLDPGTFPISKEASVLPHAGVIGTKTDVTIDLMIQDV